MDHLGNIEAPKHGIGMKEAVLDLKPLIHGHRTGSNSAVNPKMSGSLADRITKMSIYGKQGKSDIDLRIVRIRKALSDFAKQVKK